MDYAFLQQLLSLVAEFDQQYVPAPAAASSREDLTKLADFSLWLRAQVASPPLPEAVARRPRSPRESNETQLGMLITYLYRYVRSYSRLALAGSPLVTLDDFVYLATTFSQGPLTKTELIQHNIHEKTTGNEVIKRLLKQGLIQEQSSTKDRRSKLLTITETGQQLFFELFAGMRKVADLSVGNLSADELQHLVYLLLKLDSFHHPIFTASRPQSLDEMLACYLPQSRQPSES